MYSDKQLPEPMSSFRMLLIYKKLAIRSIHYVCVPVIN